MGHLQYLDQTVTAFYLHMMSSGRSSLIQVVHLEVSSILSVQGAIFAARRLKKRRAYAVFTKLNGSDWA